ncbi:MAG: 4-hydroxy-tetrahydrodipicolinate synthase [Coxiellaceae bacterium]|nr:4-hydroxy-tetrahydrodipicolinate synthase [Coxiellaceae bacterium]
MFQGSMVAIVTPFTAQNEVDYAALERLFDWHIEQGTQQIILLGTTGESANIRFEERTQMIKHAVAYINKRVPLMIGTGTNALYETLELTEQAKQLGADAAMIVTPYYIKPPQKAMIEYFAEVAKIAFPQCLYNVPSRTSIDLLPETAAVIAKNTNVHGIKEASGDVSRVKQLRDLGCDFDIVSGEDGNACEFVLAGGDGVISVVANVAPGLMRTMVDAAKAGDSTAANAINDKLSLLHKNLFLQSNPIPVKYALGQMAMIDNNVRLPLAELEQEYKSAVAAALQQADIKTVENEKCA